MRTIKFRGKRLDNELWVDGDLVTSLTPKGSMTKCPAIHTTNGTIGTFFVQPETIGQCTGLHDRNGKELYDGDIVSWITGRDGKGFMELGRVEWKQEELQYRIVNRFKTLDGRESTTSLLFKRDLTIRGNVHDNPELLEEE